MSPIIHACCLCTCKSWNTSCIVGILENYWRWFINDRGSINLDLKIVRIFHIIPKFKLIQFISLSYFEGNGIGLQFLILLWNRSVRCWWHWVLRVRMLMALNAVTRLPCSCGDQEYSDVFLQMIAALALVTDIVTFTLCWRNNGSCIRGSKNSEQPPQRSSCALKCCALSLSWSRRSHSLHPEPSHRHPPLAISKFGTFLPPKCLWS